MKKVVFFSAVSASLLGCQVLAPHEAETPQHVEKPGQSPYQIGQLNFGEEPHYMICPPRGCPQPTQKIIASATELTTTKAALQTEQVPVVAVPVELMRSEEHGVAPSSVSKPTSLLAEADPSSSGPIFVVRFEFRSAELSEEAKQVLDAAVPDLKRAGQITLLGRSDNVGSLASNNAISLERAIAVQSYLAPKLEGVAMTIKYRGRCCYAATNTTEEGRLQNRRVFALQTPRN